MASPRNILIVKLSAIGDVIHALPVASALRRCFPQAKITWVVEKPAVDLLTNHPDIDEVIVFDKPAFKSLSGLMRGAPAFVRQLRQRGFDLSLDLQGLFKSGIIAYASGAAQRLVYCNTREGSQLLSKKVCGPNAGGHVVEQYLDVVRALGCDAGQAVFRLGISEEDEKRTAAVVKQAGFSLESPYVLLAPGANWPNKRWPVRHFAELSDKLYNDNVVPVVVGAPSDRLLAEEISSLAKVPPVDLTGKTSLKQLAVVIRKARAFVGGDTGPMHLAAGLGTPAVALMGPTNIERNGPYGPGHITLIADRECYGCWKRSCPKDVECLSAIAVDRVYAALAKLLARQ